jgi:Mg2+ and Co2+ transporter CorA
MKRHYPPAIDRTKQSPVPRLEAENKELRRLNRVLETRIQNMTHEIKHLRKGEMTMQRLSPSVERFINRLIADRNHLEEMLVGSVNTIEKLLKK